MSRQLVVVLLICGSRGGIVHAQEPPADTRPAEDCALANEPLLKLRKDQFFEILIGSYNTAKIGPSLNKDFDYLPIAFRLGCRPCADRGGWLGERFSLMAEGMVAPITREFGHILGGPSLLARLDICDPLKPVVPYFQAGTGFVLNDAHQDPNQRAIGQCFEFIQQVELGARLKLNDNLSVLVEGGLRHISNAGLAGRNLGANNLGGSFGLRWNFGGR